jgi:hypothetical protein
MTQTFTDLAERCDILWQQRLSLCNSDYVTLSQLQQHDQHLLQSVQLCQRYLVPVKHDIPPWLSALLDNSAGELTTLLVLPLALPAQCVLAELWLALKHTTAAHYTKQYCRPEHSPLLCLLVATQSALITMLGALVAAALQRDQQTTIAPTYLREEILLAGVVPARHNLAALWRSGHPRQRFASAALRVLQQPGLPLAEPTSWRGGVWPVV